MELWWDFFPLVLTVLVVVIIPTAFAFCLRVKLYFHLKALNVSVRDRIDEIDEFINRFVQNREPGSRKRMIRDSREDQPEMISRLEKTLDRMQPLPDSLNTSILIDTIYSAEEFWFGGHKFNCEKVEYFLKILPNLLLAFGLLGTFLGITINLYSLSNIVQDGGLKNLDSLIVQIKQPLQGMGIAFVTSLIGLACSAILTVASIWFSTDIAKYRLIASLEEFLDNVYVPTLENTPMSKTLKEMKEMFNDFLGRFGEKVGKAVEEVVERSLGERLKQIIENVGEVTDLADRVYGRLELTINTLHRGAENFQQGSELVETSAINIRDAANSLNGKKFIQTIDRLSESVKDIGIAQTNFSEITTNLSDSTQTMRESMMSLYIVGENIVVIGDKMANLQAQVDKTMELTSQSQLLLKDSSQLIQKEIISINHISQSVVEMGDSMTRLNTKSEEVLQIVANDHNLFNGISNDIRQGIKGINLLYNSLGVLERVLTSCSETLSEDLKTTNLSYDKVYQLIQTLKNNLEKLDSVTQSLTEFPEKFLMQGADTPEEVISIDKGIKLLGQEVSQITKQLEILLQSINQE